MSAARGGHVLSDGTMALFNRLRRRCLIISQGGRPYRIFQLGRESPRLQLDTRRPANKDKRKMTEEENRAIRPATAEDQSAILDLAVASGLFQEHEAGALAEMLADAFTGGLQDHHWIVMEQGAAASPLTGAACFAPEVMSDRVWNLYFIAVVPQDQGRGLGTALLTHVEETLRRQDARLLLIETSSLDSFERTRRFYLGNGYEEEARIRDFYRAGEDKVVFRKLL